MISKFCKSKFLLSFLALLLLTGASPSSKNEQHFNADEKTSMTLTAGSKQTDISSLAIRITGSIEGGSAILIQSYKGKQRYKYILKMGKVNFYVKRHWPERECTIDYKPFVQVNSGVLRLRYKFNSK